jgi:alpha-glucoside transport system permease protein
MDNIAGTKSSLTWAVHISVAALVLLWIFPTLGLLVSSFRTTDQIRSSGWWAAMFPAVQNETFRTADPDETRVDLGEGRFMVEGNLYVVDGRVETAEDVPAEISVWGTSSRAIDAYQAGDTADLGDGETMTVQSNGDYRWEGDEEQLSGRGQRVFVTAESPPEFTLANYRNVLFDPGNREGMAKAFFNTLTVTIPATIIPILIAAFAAYALAWMDFRAARCWSRRWWRFWWCRCNWR